MSDPADIVTALPEAALHEWVLEQRWFGSKAREVAQLNVLEAVTLRSDAPALVLALAVVETHWLPEHVWKSPQLPQKRVPPQPSAMKPLVAPCAWQVVGTQAPQVFEVPPPPHG